MIITKYPSSLLMRVMILYKFTTSAKKMKRVFRDCPNLERHIVLTLPTVDVDADEHAVVVDILKCKLFSLTPWQLHKRIVTKHSVRPHDMTSKFHNITQQVNRAFVNEWALCRQRNTQGSSSGKFGNRWCPGLISHFKDEQMRCWNAINRAVEMVEYVVVA